MGIFDDVTILSRYIFSLRGKGKRDQLCFKNGLFNGLFLTTPNMNASPYRDKRLRSYISFSQRCTRIKSSILWEQYQCLLSL